MRVKCHFVIPFYRILCIFLWSAGCVDLVTAQHDSIQILPEVEVTTVRLDLTSVGKHTDRLDTSHTSTLSSRNLSQVLRQQTPLYVRSYGNGTLATLGIRGGSASHTQLMWNGIPLRNPMLGSVDLALVDNWMFDEALVYYGGHGAAFGSGAVGGLIALNNDMLREEESIDLQLRVGSWTYRDAGMRLQYGGKRVQFSTRAWSMYAKNNFRYIPRKGFEAKRQQNHRIEDVSFLQEMRWWITSSQALTLRAWFQSSDRQIPPTSVQNFSKSAQQDEHLRLSLHWTKWSRDVRWQFKSAWLEETIDFQDSLILLYTTNSFSTWLNEFDFAWSGIPGVWLTAGIYQELSAGISVSYLDKIHRQQYATFASLRWSHRQKDLRLQVREEVTDGAWSPLLADLSFDWQWASSMRWKSSVARHYRVPTLNDQNWRPGGNPELIPEQGWTFESGMEYLLEKERNTTLISITGFWRSMDQWIMWLPPEPKIRNYWSPFNIASVKSHGVELRIRRHLELDKWKFNFFSGVDLTWSEFREALPAFGIQSGDQIYYVPVENISAGISIGHKRIRLEYYHYAFGASPGINEEVQSGQVGNAELEWAVFPKEQKLNISFSLENVWNVPYRLIERRPMPGRSWQFGVKYSM